MKKIKVNSKVFQQDYLGKEYKHFDVEVELEDDVYAELLNALEAAGDSGLHASDEFPGHDIVTAAVYAHLDSLGQGDNETGHPWYDYRISPYWQNQD